MITKQCKLTTQDLKDVGYVKCGKLAQKKLIVGALQLPNRNVSIQQSLAHGYQKNKQKKGEKQKI